MRGFISPQPPSQPAAVIPASLALSAAQSPYHSTSDTSTSTGTSTRISTDINTGIATGEHSKQCPNLGACRPPRRYSPQYELASYFSAIQVDDELDPDKDDYIVPKIPDLLAMRRERLANNAALVYRDVRQRKNDNVQIATRRTAADQEEDGDDMAVDDCMDLAEGEIQLNFRPAERGGGDRVWKKKQMRMRKRSKRDKEGGGKRERDKAKTVTAAAKQAGGNSGLSAPVPAPLVSDGQHDPTHGYVHLFPSHPFQRPP